MIQQYGVSVRGQRQEGHGETVERFKWGRRVLAFMALTIGRSLSLEVSDLGWGGQEPVVGIGVHALTLNPRTGVSVTLDTSTGELDTAPLNDGGIVGDQETRLHGFGCHRAFMVDCTQGGARFVEEGVKGSDCVILRLNPV
jgi:hypothetical protein